MVHVSMAVQENLDIFHVKAQRGDVALDLRSGLAKSAVEQDVAFGRSDEEGRHIGGAHVVQVIRDPKGLHGPVPVPRTRNRWRRTKEKEKERT